MGDATLRFRRERQVEYLDCLARNASHEAVHSVHIVVEGREAYDHFVRHVLHAEDGPCAALGPSQRQKIIPFLRLQPTQPTYADLFHHANTLLPGALTMICNADVYLSPGHFALPAVEALFKKAEASPTTRAQSSRLALALTRHESDTAHDAPLIADYRGSHDAFVIRSPTPTSFLRGVTHPQNCYKAENIVLYELKQHGYRVLNPCKDLRLVHRHAADVRQWLPPVDESRYARANPMTVREAQQELML